jgi:hypothetical protein
MLPGFRFLFAATMLSMSLLIFGLGAAALLRAAHESFVSNSSWHAAPEVPFAQRPDTLPVLAALRVDMNAMERTNEQAPVAAAPTVQPPSSAAAVQNDQLAALTPVETPPAAEMAKPAELPAPTPAAETPPTAETASPPAVSSASETAAAADERKLAVATGDTTPVRGEPARSETAKSETAKTEPAKTELAPQAEPITATPANQANATPETTAVTTPADSLAATKIATLGGPPVDVTDAAALDTSMVKLPRPRPDLSAIKKRVQARRAMQRRRLALRARLLLQQQQANPFGQQQPFPPPAAAH